MKGRGPKPWKDGRKRMRVMKSAARWQAPRANGFEPLGAVIGRVRARVDEAIRARDEAEGSEAHEELLDLEHEQRVLATVRKYAK